MKRGQVTLFVILAILIVFVIAIIVYTQRFFIKESLFQTDREVIPIKTYVESCLKKTVENAVYLLGMQGGYVRLLPSQSFETQLSTVSYVSMNNQILLLSEEDMEKQLSSYIDLMLPQCVDFTKWPEFSITHGSVVSKVDMLEKSLLVNVQWPITLQRTRIHTLNEFYLELPIRLKLIRGIALNVVNRTGKSIDLGYMADVNEKYNITVSVSPFNDTIVYSIIDPHSILFDRPYVFLFAEKL